MEPKSGTVGYASVIYATPVLGNAAHLRIVVILGDAVLHQYLFVPIPGHEDLESGRIDIPRIDNTLFFVDRFT